jgi:glycogen operon protein
MATLLLSQGIPMIVGGDEQARTQGGNNNAYCQDNQVSWFDWEAADGAMTAYTQRLIELRRQHPVFRRRRYFQGRALHGQDADIAWFRPDGVEMTEHDWRSGFAKSMAVFLNGDAIPDPGPRGEHITDDSFLVLFNAHHERLDFVLPESVGTAWVSVVDTFDALAEGERYKLGDVGKVEGRSLVVMRRMGPAERPAG